MSIFRCGCIQETTSYFSTVSNAAYTMLIDPSFDFTIRDVNVYLNGPSTNYTNRTVKCALWNGSGTLLNVGNVITPTNNSPQWYNNTGLDDINLSAGVYYVGVIGNSSPVYLFEAGAFGGVNVKAPSNYATPGNITPNDGSGHLYCINVSVEPQSSETRILAGYINRLGTGSQLSLDDAARSEITVPSTIEISKIHCWVVPTAAAAKIIKFAIWDSSNQLVSGSVSTEKTTTATTTLNHLYHEYSTPVQLTAGTYYIGCVCGASSLNVISQIDASNTSVYFDTAYSYANMNETFTVGTAYKGRHSFWVEYNNVETGYGNKVYTVPSEDIGSIHTVETANISKVYGVE